MRFLIPLGIKINFLFYPWSALNQSGLGLPSWENLRTPPSTKSSQCMGMDRSSTCPGDHISSQIHYWMTGETEKDKSLFWVSNGPVKKDVVKWLNMPTCHESIWTGLFSTRGKVQRGERVELENPVTWDHTTTDYLQYHCYIKAWCLNTSGLTGY